MKNGLEIDKLVRAFARVLAASWNEVGFACSLSTTPYFVENWLEAQWEMLVEAALPPGVFLFEYGEGADFGEMSSRVHYPEVAPTHVVVCKTRVPDESAVDLITGRLVSLPSAGIPFSELVARAGTWYERKPPFDCVLIEHDGLDCVISLEQVSFSLRPILRITAPNS